MKKPMMNLRAFKHPMFTLGVVTVFICMMIILSSMLVLPIYLQSGFGMTAFAAGLLMLPGGIVNGVMSPIMGKLFDRYGPRWLVLPGFVVAAAALWFFSGVTPASASALIIVLHSVLMIGISMIMMPAQTNGMNQLPRELYPDGTAIMNTLQQVAGAIGTALAVSIMTAGSTDYFKTAQNPDPVQGLTAGAQDAFLFGMIVAAIGFVLSFFVKRVIVKGHKS